MGEKDDGESEPDVAPVDYEEDTAPRTVALDFNGGVGAVGNGEGTDGKASNVGFGDGGGSRPSDIPAVPAVAIARNTSESSL